VAKIFLSYARADADKAREIAAVLEEAGHVVWWDRHIKGGAQYGKAIEQALKAADSVVVLWSVESVESTGVRDEAAAGRDSGRLIPIRIDATEPPLGFRQFHALDLSSWTGRGEHPCLTDMLAAVGTPSPQLQAGRRAKPRRGLKPMVAALLMLVVVVTTGLGAWMLIDRPSSVPTIAVGSADDSPASQSLARDLLVKLGGLQSRAAHPLSLVKERSGPKPTLVFNISAAGSTTRPEAAVALFDGKDHSLLWSEDFQQPSGNRADLRQQVAHTAGQVLACAMEGLQSDSGRLTQQPLKLYLKGCAAYADKTSSNVPDLLPPFLQLTTIAPSFAGGWGKLLLVESEFTRMGYDPRSATIVAQLRKHIAAARNLNPHMPEVSLAEAALLPDMSFERRIALLERAVADGPGNAAALSILSENLLTVGRMNEAVEQAQRAVQANPLSPATRDSLIAALTYAGRADQAAAELQRVDQLWPGSSSVLSARFRIHLRYGDPTEAKRLIRSGQINISSTPYVDSFVEARIHPTPANIGEAVGEARSFYDREPTVIYHLAQVLATFGREEELFPILLNWPYPNKVSFVTDVLFRPALRNVRRDPRLMAIAKRLGLLDYWRNSGQWPDFCFEADLPYDCKKEAAKLTV
jgi:tetratricopeptide (TPR) repeat protein